MKPPTMKLAVSILRWTLGLVVLLESVRFMFSTSSAHDFSRTGFPLWIRFALGGSEIIAAILFLVPATSKLGSYLLLFIFSVAIGIHFLHGALEVGSLVVYSAAVLVCMHRGEEEVTVVSHAR